MAEINRIKGVVVGQYGEAIAVTIVDKNGVAVDISSYSGTKTATLRSPDNLKTIPYTATFVNSGTDGQLQFTPASGDIDRDGNWELQFSLAAGGTVVRKTQVAIIEVEKSLS